MAEEFQAEVCGESRWNYSTKSFFGNSSAYASSFHDPIGHNFAWPISDLLDMKDKSSEESCSDDSMVLQELPKHDHLLDSFSSTPVNLSTDYSTLQMWEIGLSSSSSTPDWNQSLVSHDKLDSNYLSMLQEDNTNSRLNYRQEKRLDCPELKRNLSSISEASSSNSLKLMNQGFTLGLQPLNPITISSTAESIVTSPTLNSSFAYSSELLQKLFDTDPQQPQQSLFDNNPLINYPSSTNYTQNLNDFAPSFPKFPDLLKPSLAKQAPPNLLTSSKSDIEEIKELTTSSVTENRSNESSYKRPRIETPSPLPTFKVRKEKMGDRITALQQLVSPFGKTDTASVLQEAIEYIKFLHDQVNVLSTPYMKNGSPTQHQQVKEQGVKQELRERGLCLVPMSSTFPAAAETTMDFWTPALGGSFR